MKKDFSLCAFADEAAADLEGQIRALKENGISMIELRGVNGVNVADLTREQATEIKDRLLDAGIAVWSLGSPAGKTQITRDFSFEEEQFKRLLETADIMSAGCVRLFSFYGTEDHAGVRNEVISRLCRFAELAKDSGVFLCHENEKGIYGDNAERCLDLLTNVPGLYAVFDPANFVQCGQDTVSAWDTLEKYVYYCHIKDALPDGRVVPAGEGCGNLPYILGKYAKTGGVLTAEPHLAEFVGLKSLENPDGASVVGGLRFENSRAAFDCGVNSLKKLISEVN